MTDTVRIVVCGDEGNLLAPRETKELLAKKYYAGTGKSSLITSLVKDIFVTSKIQPVLPAITIGAPENVTTTIVDTTGMFFDFDRKASQAVEERKD